MKRSSCWVTRKPHASTPSASVPYWTGSVSAIRARASGGSGTRSWKTRSWLLSGRSASVIELSAATRVMTSTTCASIVSGPARARPRRGGGRRARSAARRCGRRRSAASRRRAARPRRCARSAPAPARTSGGTRGRTPCAGRRCRRSSRSRSTATPRSRSPTRPSASTTSSKESMTSTSPGSRRSSALSWANTRRRRARRKSSCASCVGNPVSRAIGTSWLAGPSGAVCRRALAQLDRLGRRQQHRQPGARVARRGAPLAQHDRRPAARRRRAPARRRRRPRAAPSPSCAPRAVSTAIALGSCSLPGSRRSVSAAPGRPRRTAGPSSWKRAAPGDAGDDQPALGQLRRVAREVAPRLRVDGRVAGDPDDRAVVGIPVALLVLDRYVSDAQTTSATASWIAADTSAAGCSLLLLAYDAELARRERVQHDESDRLRADADRAVDERVVEAVPARAGEEDREPEDQPERERATSRRAPPR